MGSIQGLLEALDIPRARDQALVTLPRGVENQSVAADPMAFAGGNEAAWRQPAA